MNSNSNIENAVAGRYNFQISSIFGEAWEKTVGVKGRFWGAFILIFIITIVLTSIAFGIDFLVLGVPDTTSENAMATSPHPVANIIQMIFSIFITTPLFAGLLMLSIKHCVGITVPASSVFNYFSYWKKLWVYPVVMTGITLVQTLDIGILSFIAFLLMLFLAVTYFMFIPLIADKNLPIMEALESSRKTIFHHWFKMLWFLILIGLIMIASGLTLGIALIWTLPWVYNAIAILYRNMFGVQQ